jgi:hypothetical protein
MWYRLELRVRADVDDEALHEIPFLANTYAIVDEVLARGIPRPAILDSRAGSMLRAPKRRSAPYSP